MSKRQPGQYLRMQPSHPVPDPVQRRGGMTREQLIDMFARAGGLLGLSPEYEQVKIGGPGAVTVPVERPAGMPLPPGPGLVSEGMQGAAGPASRFMARIRKALPGQLRNTVASAEFGPGETHHVIEPGLAQQIQQPMGRRRFFKAATGAGVAGYAAMRAGEREAATMAERAIAHPEGAIQAVTAAQELGPAPLRVYERVGNKFILTQEVPLDPETARLHEYFSSLNIPHEVIPGRPYGSIRHIDPRTLNPELEMLSENSVMKAGQQTNITGHDPYAKRLVDLHRKMDAAIDPNTGKSFYNAADRENLLIPHHAYVVEKPVRVRYIEKGRPREIDDGIDDDILYQIDEYEKSLHPEIWKLPLDQKRRVLTDTELGDLRDEDYINAPRLIGSGDTYDEALQKAHTFLNDIGIKPSDIKVGAGKKVIRWTLPNGDVIEIRKVPRLEMKPSHPPTGFGLGPEIEGEP